MASAERIFQILDTPVATEELPLPAQNYNILDGHVIFNNVSFGYDAKQQILHKLSFEVSAGSSLAIVGATGAGKTTIINLLEKFYRPDNGEIKISGNDIQTMNTNWLRRQIGLVMQDIFILPATIRENILLDSDATNDQLQVILEQSQLLNFVNSQEDGLDTLIGEGGMDLSAGQKQLLSFARVLARNPKILMLDEATSNVDSETEMLVNRAMTSAMSDRTSIIIAHRLSTIRRVDTILVMDKGKIVEHGSHEALLQQNGYYRYLHELQFRSDNFLSPV
jgi:ATP-binding cassette subfamily B protein